MAGCVVVVPAGPQLHFILDETILHRLVGDRIVMHDQMRKLLQATEKPNITVQVLPRDVGGSPGLEGSFILLTLPAPIPDIGYTEGPAGTLYIENRDRVRYWVLRFGILTQRALSCQESAGLIAEVMHNFEWPEGGQRMTRWEPLAQIQWRVSSFTKTGAGNGGSCVEVAALPDGRIAVRNSNHPDVGTVLFTRAEMHAWIEGVKASEFDDLA